jgi:hypothetical protein
MIEGNQNQQDRGDGWADAIAASAIVAIVITWVVYWLSGLPA